MSEIPSIDPSTAETGAEKPVDYLQLMSLTLQEAQGDTSLAESNATKRERFLKGQPLLTPDHAILAGLVSLVPREELEIMANPGPSDSIDPRAQTIAKYFLEQMSSVNSGDMYWPLVRLTEQEIQTGEEDSEATAQRAEYIERLTEEGLLDKIRDEDFLRMGIADRVTTDRLREIADTGDTTAQYFLEKRGQS